METMIAVPAATEIIVAGKPAYNAAGSSVNLPSTYNRSQYNVTNTPTGTAPNPLATNPKEVAAFILLGVVIACFFWNYDGRR